MQVYVVECGDEETRHIAAIFTTREDAERCAAALGNAQDPLEDAATVSMWRVDPPITYPTMPRWKVVLTEQGTPKSCHETPHSLDEWDVQRPLGRKAYDDGFAVVVTCCAPDVPGALVIAHGEWERLMKERVEREAERKVTARN